MPKNSQDAGDVEHIPVLSTEVLKLLQPTPGQSYLDLTAGAGGHATAVLAVTEAPKKAVLVDRDQEAISILHQRFKAAQIVHQDFLSASRELRSAGQTFDMILADLGASSLHLNKAERGFSFLRSGPLDMRMDSSQDLTAGQIVNSWSEQQLARILADFGQEPKARSIARKIVVARPIKTTAELAAIAVRRWPGHSRVHPATRTFQALRIAVNDELRQLKDSLPIWMDLLAPGGRLAVISFHSLEDQIVKSFLAENSGGFYDSQLKLLTRKPLSASHQELVFNPRARSAKLRAAAKIKNRKDQKEKTHAD